MSRFRWVRYLDEGFVVITTLAVIAALVLFGIVIMNYVNPLVGMVMAISGGVLFAIFVGCGLFHMVRTAIAWAKHEMELDEERLK